MAFGCSGIGGVPSLVPDDMMPPTPITPTTTATVPKRAFLDDRDRAPGFDNGEYGPLLCSSVSVIRP